MAVVDRQPYHVANMYNFLSKRPLMTVVTYSEARNRLKHLCDQVRRSRKPARIHRRGGDVIVLAAEDWDAIQETLHIASIPGARTRIRKARDFKTLRPVTRDALEKLIRR
jgi:prevent-host-death family protein